MPTQHLRGFSLIEVLVVLMIIGILTSLTRLAIPNQEQRHWTNETQQLVSILNQAHDESVILGIHLEAVVDSQGWRFYQYSPQQEPILMKDIFAPHVWEKPVEVKSVQRFLIGDPLQNKMSPLLLTRNQQSAQIVRELNGRFLLQP